MNVFSFCLYGPYNDRYYPGMIQNIQLIHKHFPGWFVYVYLGSDVTPDMVSMLQSAPRVIVRFTGITGIVNMVHRFFPIDDPGVDVMFVRDADSRIHSRDRWAIQRFLESPYIAHTIRDHPDHKCRLMGGLWGMRKTPEVNIHEQYALYEENPEYRGMAWDQDFLSSRIFPLVASKLLAHIGLGPSFPPEKVEALPPPWTDELYCGKIEPANYVEPLARRPLNLPTVRFNFLSRM
jgi:protein O-GlcNAc transferase